MLRFTLLLVTVLLLTSCQSMKLQAKQEKQEDREACAASGYKEGSDSYVRCLEVLESRRAQEDFRKAQRDLEEFDRMKHDRTSRHLISPGF